MIVDHNLLYFHFIAQLCKYTESNPVQLTSKCLKVINYTARFTVKIIVIGYFELKFIEIVFWDLMWTTICYIFTLLHLGPHVDHNLLYFHFIAHNLQLLNQILTQLTSKCMKINCTS